MANRDNPNGFSPWGRTLQGGELELRPYTKLATYATAIYPGDVVNQVASGDLERSITPSTTLIVGVALDYGAASTLTDHMVADQPDMIFVAQTNDDTITVADKGSKADVVLGTGSLVLKRSRDEINGATVLTTGTLDLILLRLARIQGNADGEWARWEVVINKHLLNKGATGI